MEQEFGIGERIIIELNSRDLYEGTFVRGCKNRVEIDNVIRDSKSVGTGISTFYRSEIIKIYRCKEKVQKFAEPKPMLSCRDEPTVKTYIDDEELRRLQTLSHEYIYMDLCDARYFEACEKLSQAETVGVVGIGLELDRRSTIKLLVLTTWQQVYILDFINLICKKFPKELQTIFESHCVTKVIHGAGPLIDSVYRTYKVSIENVFDTQVLDLVFQKQNKTKCEELRTLGQCLNEYLNLPLSLLEDPMAVSRREWKKRPIKLIYKFYAAQLGAYLFTLKDHMQKLLHKDVFKAMDDVHWLYFNSDDYQFTKRVMTNECPKDVDDLIPRLNYLPITNCEPSTSTSKE